MRRTTVQHNVLRAVLRVRWQEHLRMAALCTCKQQCSFRAAARSLIIDILTGILQQYYQRGLLIMHKLVEVCRSMYHHVETPSPDIKGGFHVAPRLPMHRIRTASRRHYVRKVPSGIEAR